jgi:DNA polymerase
MLFGDPFEAVISGLRHSIMAAPDRTLNVGDYNTVEARIVLAIAGAQNALAILQDKNRDVYAEMAATIFDHIKAPYGKDEVKRFKVAHLAERQTGKNTVLGCGFQMGAPKFQLRYAKDKPLEFAKKCIDAYREDFAPEVPELWYGLEEAACRAVWDRRPTEAYGIEYRHEDIWLTCRLHSGRKLYYPFPQPVKKAMPWDETDIRPAWTCKASKNGRFITRDMYGGLLTENVVQATARDLLVDAILKCEKDNLPVVLTVHDEAVTEPLHHFSDHVRLQHIMEDRPRWAVELGVPIAAETWAGDRYRK